MQTFRNELWNVIKKLNIYNYITVIDDIHLQKNEMHFRNQHIYRVEVCTANKQKIFFILKHISGE